MNAMPESNLKQKTASAIAWSTIDKFGIQILGFVIGIILARYFLTPADYGLMGMITIFTVLSGVLLDSGFSSALIRKVTISQTEISTMFHFNLGMSIVAYLIMFFCAPFIAALFQYPILTNICRINSFVFILNAFIFTQNVTFTRNANFKPIAISNIVGITCAGILAIILAYKGFGVYSLVYQNLFFVFIRGAILWLFSHWRPSFLFDFQVIKNLWGYSSKVLLTGVLNSIFNYISPVLIGLYYPAKDVGLYTQGNKISDMASQSVSSSLQSATFPILSQLQNDNERLKRAYRKIVRVTSFISFPLLFGLSAVSIPFIHVLLTEQWHDSAVYLQILCIGAAFIALINLNLNILYVKGLSTISLLFEIIRKGLIVLAIFITFRYGIKPLAMGISSVSIFAFFLSSFFVKKQINYTLSEQLKDIFPYVVIAAVMAAGLYLLSFVITGYSILLPVQLVTGIAFYLGTVYLLGSKVMREMISLVRKKL